MTNTGKVPSQQTTKTTTRRNVEGQPSTTTQKTSFISSTIPTQSRQQRKEFKRTINDQKKPIETQEAAKKTTTTVIKTTPVGTSKYTAPKAQTFTAKKATPTTTTNRTQSPGKSEINFKYKDNKVPISFTPDEKMKTLIERFCIKKNVNKNNLTFRLNNDVIDEDSSVEKLLFNDKNLSIIVSQNDINNHLDEIRIRYKKKMLMINI